jgi:RNA polymerase sigma-B factor
VMHAPCGRTGSGIDHRGGSAAHARQLTRRRGRGGCAMTQLAEPTRAPTQHPSRHTEPVDVAQIDAVVGAYLRDTAGLPVADRERRRRREHAVQTALPFAGRLARRYGGRGEPLDDLEQVANLALVRSLDRYDPERGPFTAYAAATIIGELRRHFRDTGWAMHVPRRLQEMSLEVGRATETLTNELARAPKVADLARHLGTTEKQVSAAIQTTSAYAPASLNAPRRDSGVELGELIGDVDRQLSAVDDRITVAVLLRRLPPRERQLLTLRFYGNLTQAEIAAELGISQMHVSRLISRALGWLREAMLSDEPLRWQSGSATPARLEVRVSGATVAVTGEIDRDSVPRFQDRLLATVRRQTGDVVVDFKGVLLIDAAGIAVLQAAYEAAHARGRRVLVRRATRLVRRSMLAAGLLPLLDPPPPGTVGH